MISIIVPVYNTVAFLDQCLESIVAQEYQDWECILVDDGSTDGSDRICDIWARKDSRIRAIHQPNSGVSAARNRGIGLCRGEHICFIDSDDWVCDSYLSSLWLKASEEQFDLIVSGIVQVDVMGKSKEFIPPAIDVTIDAENVSQFVELNRLNLLYGPTSILYRKDKIDENIIRFPEDCSYGEDLVFNYSYFNNAQRIGCVPSGTYYYRINGNNSLSTRYRADRFDTDYSQWKLLKEFYEHRGMWNAVSKAYLYQKLWGIIYDGIFETTVSQKKIKEILSISEIPELKQWQDSFKSAGWIKCSILNRQDKLLYLAVKSSKLMKG